MDFCPNCNNVFDITKGDPEQRGGEDNMAPLFNVNNLFGGAKDDDFYADVIRKIINKEKLTVSELDKITLDDLSQSDIYKKLKNKQKQYIFNTIQDQLQMSKKQIFNEDDKSKPVLQKAYFMCNNCGYKKPIKPGTLIFSKVSSDVSQKYSSVDVSNLKHSDILPRTRKYACPNKTCISYTDIAKREAVFFRMNNTFKVKYICLACDTAFSS